MPTLFCTMLLSSAVQTTKGSDFESFFKPSAYLTAILTTGETLLCMVSMVQCTKLELIDIHKSICVSARIGPWRSDQSFGTAKLEVPRSGISSSHSKLLRIENGFTRKKHELSTSTMRCEAHLSLELENNKANDMCQGGKRMPPVRL